MTALGVTALGVSSAQGATGLSALAALARWKNAPEPGADRDAAKALMAIRRRIELRYLDPVSERSVQAVEAMGAEAGTNLARNEADWRTGIVMVTRYGPSATRSQLYGSMIQRQGGGASATLFSSCGYNIAAAVTAKLLGARGPVLTFAATPHWGVRTFRLAEVLFARHQVERLFLCCADGGAAIAMLMEPWERVEARKPIRVIQLCSTTAGAKGGPAIVVGVDPELSRLALEVEQEGCRCLKQPLTIESQASAFALNQTFLALAWLWESVLSTHSGQLKATVGDGPVIAFNPIGELESSFPIADLA